MEKKNRDNEHAVQLFRRKQGLNVGARSRRLTKCESIKRKQNASLPSSFEILEVAGDGHESYFLALLFLLFIFRTI